MNNLTIALCAVGVCFLFLYHDQWKGTWILIFMEAVVIILAAIAALASETSKIILEKDWIIVIAGNDNDQLASKFIEPVLPNHVVLVENERLLQCLGG